ncbi:TonB-dependent receptor plug domain-containing protein [Methylocystis echinoides]|uniref:TonB-dependent receptor n=1 Tax=Methylocystis echinoides TaxID=29468 RepID=A0A9W6GZ87_9HYPH|nr:TonB-dependent receptor [Methylocystis echinoides]GLI95699.1 TonB-dependent receptor [Methylocystis echinoides]
MQFDCLLGADKGVLARASRYVLPCLLPFILSSAALAQQALPAIDIGRNSVPATDGDVNNAADSSDQEIVVTPDRVEEPRSRTASSVSVVTSAQVNKWASLGLANALRGVPGLDLYESGGPGTQTSVFLRGATPGQTLVLIDGIRVGDASSTDGSVDLGMLAATDIDRIEVLRGPQSALYGSDAMGGVINIITRKGQGKPRGSVMLEGGAYGTGHTRATVSGSEDRLSYAFSVDALHAEAFPRYGYRINRPLTIGDGVTPLPPLPPNDPTNRIGATARLSYQLTDALSVEGGFTGYDNAIRFDNPYAFVAADVFNVANHSHATFAQGYARADADLFDRTLHNRVTIYANETSRDVWQTESCFDANFNAYTCRLGYRGKRRGLEYQGDLKLGAFGLATFGAVNWTDSAHTSQGPIPADPTAPVDFVQTTHSGFGQHQFTLFERLDLTYGGRIDSVQSNQSFATWRATAAFRLDETGTKFRGTAGTGAKVASLYQRFSQYGDPNLKPERSTGYDVGFDQKLLGERVTASVSFFDNRFQNLIDFGSVPTCSITQVFGCYFNVGRAETKGIEFAGEAEIIPQQVRLRASYTHLVAKNLVTERSLFRRPPDKGMASLIYTGIPGLELETRLLAISETPDYDFINAKRVTRPAYARADLYANYRFDERFSIFGRVENVGNTYYQEAYNYGTPGRSLYGGMKFTW